MDGKVDQDLHRHSSCCILDRKQQFGTNSTVNLSLQMNRCQRATNPPLFPFFFICQITVICNEGRKPVAVMLVMLFKLFTTSFLVMIVNQYH